MPTLPLSGGKLNTVMASFFSAVRFFASCAQGEQRRLRACFRVKTRVIYLLKMGQICDCDTAVRR